MPSVTIDAIATTVPSQERAPRIVTALSKKRFAQFDIDRLSPGYEARVLEPPVLTRELADVLWGFVEIQTVRFTLANADGALTPGYLDDLRGQTVEIDLYDPDDPDGPFQLHDWRGRVNRATLRPNRLEIEAVNVDLAKLEDLIPQGLVTTAPFPNALDVGKCPPWVFGNVAKVPGLIINHDVGNNRTDVLFARGSVTLSAIYRSLGDFLGTVDATEYTVSTTLYSGYTVARFPILQIDFQNAPHRFWADVTGLAAERNFARAIKTILSDTTHGLGVGVNAASFTTAEAALDAVGGLFCDGAMLDQVQAQTILQELLTVRGMRLGTNANGEYTLTADTEKQVLQLVLADGAIEGERNVVSADLRQHTSAEDAVSTIVSKYRVDHVDDTLLFEQTRTISATMGKRKIYEWHFVRDHTTADKITDNLYKRLLYGEETVEVVSTLEARKFDLGDLVRLTYPALAYYSALLEVARLRKLETTIELTLAGYNNDIYTYAAGTLPSDNLAGSFTDYRRTPPTAASALVIASSGTERATNGEDVAFVIVQFTAPTTNILQSIVRHRQNGTTAWSGGIIPTSTGAGVQVKVPGLVPGLAYDYTVAVINPFGLVSLSDPVLTNQLAPGDTTVPSAPSAISVRQSGAKIVEIDLTFTAPADWATTQLYRNTSNNSGTATLIETGKKKRFHDENVSYGTTYYYWGKVVDLTGNLSGFSPSSAHSITVAKIVTIDVDDDSITTPKIPDEDITSAKRQNMNTTIFSISFTFTTLGQKFIGDVQTVTHSLGKRATVVPSMENIVEVGGNPATPRADGVYFTVLQVQSAGTTTFGIRIGAEKFGAPTLPATVTCTLRADYW